MRAELFHFILLLGFPNLPITVKELRVQSVLPPSGVQCLCSYSWNVLLKGPLRSHPEEEYGEQNVYGAQMSGGLPLKEDEAMVCDGKEQVGLIYAWLHQLL